jgi:hypothetical protein
MKDELMYLLFVISQYVLKMDLDKVRAIVEWPFPKRTVKVRGF